MNHDQYFSYLATRSTLGRLYRNLLLYPILNKHLEGNMLDVGCGIGDMLKFRKGAIGVDVNPRLVEHCRSRGLEARLMTADRLPFPDGRFRSALLDNVLEHLEQPMPLLREIRRVLEPEHGIFLVGVPGLKGWLSDRDHKVCYDETTLIERVEAAGFEGLQTFHTPLFKSSYLSRSVRQYCIYGKFRVSKAAISVAP
jgi:SAM-dependent methyltransferase